MARKAAQKAPRKKSHSFDEKNLTKGQLRKLNALRKSIGDEIANDAFAKWLAEDSAGGSQLPDRNAEQIVGALEPLIKSNKLRIPRGGYLVKRGRGRVIVSRAAQAE